MVIAAWKAASAIPMWDDEVPQVIRASQMDDIMIFPVRQTEDDFLTEREK